MSDSHALQQAGDGAPAEMTTREFSRKEVELLKRTIAQDATDTELSMFIQNCKRYGLDPFTGQIHAVKRWDKSAGREVLNVQVGIDGFRLIADRTGKWQGTKGPYWCDKDGEWTDVWLKDSNPAAAKVGVLRSDFSEPRWGIARWDAYVATKKGGAPTFMWRKMPAHMLAKCAEALALRSAFPNDLSGLYTDAEMDQAGGQDKRTYDGPDPDQVQDVEAEVVNNGDGGKPDQWYKQATESLKEKVREGMDPAQILAYADEAPTSHPIDDWPEEKAKPLIEWLKSGKATGAGSTSTTPSSGQAPAPDNRPQDTENTRTEASSTSGNDRRRYDDADDALSRLCPNALEWGQSDSPPPEDRRISTEKEHEDDTTQLGRLMWIADKNDWKESWLERFIKDELGFESKKHIPWGDPYDEICEALEDDEFRFWMSRDPDTKEMQFEGEANDEAFSDGVDDDDLPF